jgi:hypothetical protein
MSGSRPPLLATVLLCAGIVPPSAFVVREYLGTWSVLLLLVLGPAAIALALHVRERFRPAERTARRATAVVILVFVAAFLLDYPSENVHHGGLGTDRDDALEQATVALLEGRFPYRERTYLGNRITPMPGGLLLSAPFALAGGAVYGNLFWIGAFTLLIARLASWWSALVLLTVTAFSPVALHGLLHGSDFVANSAAVLIGFVLALESSGKRRIAALVLLGVALSWRMSFVFVLLVLAVALLRHEGPRAAASVAISLAVFGLVTAPFALYDWSGFAPIHIVAEVDALPGGTLAPSLVAFVLAIGSARWLDGRTGSALRAAFIVLWAPATIVALGAMIGGNWAWLEYMGLPLYFAVAGVAADLRDGKALAPRPRGA